MSFNQSKSAKSEAVYRKSGRSASFNQRRGKGGGGGPAPLVTSASSLSSSRSFNKSKNAQGGQSRVNPTPVNSTESNSTSAARAIQNGTHVQPQLHGVSDAPVTTKSSETSAAQRSTRVVPKAPTSQSPPLSSDPAAPTTPAKGDAPKAFPFQFGSIGPGFMKAFSSDPAAPTTPAKGDAPKAFPFQFGSISPGFMKGMAIPARTSSATPNLDEQKHDQARHDSFRSVPSVPTTPVLKQQQPPRKDAGVTDESNVGETHVGAKARKDPLVSALNPASQVKKPSVVPVTGISMAMPYHQSQASLQFGGPNPQNQSQGMSTTSLRMPIPMLIPIGNAQIQSQDMLTTSLQMPIPMPLPIGNAAQVQQQVFVPGLQHHPMHPQGIMHQGQNMSFTPQMGHQLSHQLGNMGIGISPQYPQQQDGKFAGRRKSTTVNIYKR